MNYEKHFIPNQIFRLRDGKGAKFFSRELKRPGPCPITLIRDGHLYNYDVQGRYLGNREHKLNIESALPLAHWEVALGRCREGQLLLMRDYSFTTLAGFNPQTHGVLYKLRDSAGTETEHNHNGWATHANCENDAIAYFDFPKGATPAARSHVTSLQGLLDRLRSSLDLPEKDKRKLEFDRVVVGMEHLLSKVLQEITQ